MDLSTVPRTKRRIYRLTDNGLEDLDTWLRKVRGYWNDRLDRLERLLAEHDNPEEKPHG